MYVPSCTVECAVDYGSVLLVTARVKGEDVKRCKGPEGSVFGSSGQHHNGLCVCVCVREREREDGGGCWTVSLAS